MSRLDGLQVLIVEDEPIIALALEDMLESIGCQTTAIATRVDEALSLLRATAIDAAILDVNIHGEQSYPLADLLVSVGTPFIFATGYGDTQHPERHRRTITLTKPYSRGDVERALAQATGR